MMRYKQSKGFTLVELNIAIVFVAFLLLAVATTTMSVTRTYQYGVSLKTINQLGREVADQIRRDAMMASPSLVEYIEPTDGIGRLCFGNVSYVFNDANLLNEAGPVTRVVDDALKPITLVRINDFGKEWCKDTSKDALSSTDVFTELLLNDSVPVAIHSLQFETIVGTADDAAFAEKIIQITFDIGTNEVETTSGGQCKPPTNPDQNFDNCAVRQFVIIARAAGG